MIVTIVVAVGAVLSGVFGRRLLRRQLESLKTPTLTVRDFVLPLQALTVFVLAFVLVTASNSNGRAEEAVRKEAKALGHMYDVAGGTVTATLIVTTALLTSVLLVIRDVERPFSGVIRISSGVMTAVEDDLTENFTAAYGENRLPCDSQGNPHRAAR